MPLVNRRSFIGACGGFLSASCYAQTARPIFRPEDYGASGQGHTDDTKAIQEALEEVKRNHGILMLRGNYLVSQMMLDGSDYDVETAPGTTLLHKKGGGRRPLIWITGSRISVADLDLVGNIDTDEGEWNHGVEIGGARDPVTRISLGNIRGRRIRGDVLYVGGTGEASVTHIRAGRISGDDVFRSICSITGAKDVLIEAVRGGWCGYTTLDIEPNDDQGTFPDEIRVNLVEGSKFQIAGQLHHPVGTVRILRMILDDRQTRQASTPYPNFDRDVGASLTNWTNLEIGSIACYGKRWCSIFAAFLPEQVRGKLSIQSYLGVDNGLDPSRTNRKQFGEMHLSGAGQVRIERATITKSRPSDQRCFTADPSTKIIIANKKFKNCIT